MYKEMKTHLVAEFRDKQIAVQLALTKFIKLRQITAGFIYDKEEGTQVAYQVQNPSKLRELKSTLEELGNQQVIIWVQFHQEVFDVLSLLGDRAVTLYSGTDSKLDSIDRFKAGQVQYLIAHPRSAGHGLTFVNASTSIFYSIDYSYEAHYQARERIHRIGQKNACLYIYLLADQTIDQDIYKVLTKKQTLQDAVYNALGKQFK